MLSGSMAMSVYIIPRATRDFDFIVHINKSDVKNFVSEFKEGFYCDEDSVFDAIEHQSMFNIIDFESGYKADFVVLKNQEYRNTEFNRRNTLKFDNRDVFIVSREDLLLSKLIWIQEIFSPVQYEDIEQLSLSEKLDWNYINHWIMELNLNTFDLLKQ
jgi:Nucleotidyltransferase of unknown function (DUF6036)